MSSFENDPLVVKVNAQDFSEGGSLITHPSNPRKRLTLVMFKANWCGHCVALKEPFRRAAHQLQQQNVNLAVYESTIGNNSAKMNAFKDFHIAGFPTLVLFYDGVFVRMFDGGRTQDSIVNFMLTNINQLQNQTAMFSSSRF